MASWITFAHVNFPYSLCAFSSTVMNFDYDGLRVNILDTPGHQDFSEDTYRALAAGMCTLCFIVVENFRMFLSYRCDSMFELVTIGPD